MIGVGVILLACIGIVAGIGKFISKQYKRKDNETT